MAQLDRFKLTAVCWDSDKEPNKFNSWMETFSSLVRSTEHGPPLEDFLDKKLGRVTSQPVAVPSFISADDDFDPPPVSSDEDEEVSNAAPDVAASSRTGSGRSASTAFTLLAANVKYRDMSAASRTLDALLYNILKMNVKGSKNALLSCVTFPSYVQAVSVLVKHMDISRNDRKTRAFEQADKLTYRGDVHAYQIEAINVIKELFDAKCSIMDYALTKVMQSFDGKCKQIQYDIAKDINTQDIGDHTNVFDMIQGYCADIASVGDSKATSAHAVGEACTYCGKPGHIEKVCFKKQRDDSGHAHDSSLTLPANVKCRYCRQKGHKLKTARRRRTEAPRVPHPHPHLLLRPRHLQRPRPSHM